MIRGWLVVGCLIAVTTTGEPRAAAAPPSLMIYAASSLTNALEDLAPGFAAQSGARVRFSYAASSTLARQIEAGAEADVFISADPGWMDYLAVRTRIVSNTRANILGNTLVLVVPVDRTATVELTTGFDLAGLLGRGRLATGDPAHVPVGKYARQALIALGAWSVAESKLVPTDSARAALALVERGEVPAAIVYQKRRRVVAAGSRRGRLSVGEPRSDRLRGGDCRRP